LATRLAKKGGKRMKKKVLLGLGLGLVLMVALTGCFLPVVRVNRGELLSVSEPTVLPKAFLQAFLDGAGVPLQLEYSIQAFSITYRTVRLDGNSVVESGLVVLPLVDEAGARLALQVPLLSLQHGTIFSRDLSPSNFSTDFTADNPEDFVALIAAGLGYATVMADYSGLGVDTSVFHPFCLGDSIASSVLDMIRAGKKLLEQKAEEFHWNGELFLAGYSEGGYATMASSRLIQEQHANEFAITGTAPMAGPYNLSTVMKGIVTGDGMYEHLEYLAYLVFGYDGVYNLFDTASEIFLPPYDVDIPPLMDGNHSSDEVRAVMPGGGIGRASELFTPGLLQQLQDPSSAISQALLQNDLYQNWIPQVPLFMVHSAGDEAVPVENSRTAVAYYRSQGSDVTYVELPEGKHVESYLPAYLLAINWIESLNP